MAGARVVLGQSVNLEQGGNLVGTGITGTIEIE